MGGRTGWNFEQRVETIPPRGMWFALVKTWNKDMKANVVSPWPSQDDQMCGETPWGVSVRVFLGETGIWFGELSTSVPKVNGHQSIHWVSKWNRQIKETEFTLSLLQLQHQPPSPALGLQCSWNVGFWIRTCIIGSPFWGLRLRINYTTSLLGSPAASWKIMVLIGWLP